jgi:iron complex outermembrane receptor protein
MMFNNNRVRRALQLAFMTGAAATFAFTAPIHAQEQDADEEEEFLEEVVVTGSRISGRTDISSATPVSVFGEEDIDAAGNATLEGFIQAQPFVTGASLGSRVNNGNRGYATISMRGLGSNRTLVLVDGHRLPPVNATGFVDLNMVPVSAVERIEVLRDGASTVYGSDAIAGVVNIITKKDFDGVDIRAQFDVTDEGDGEIYRLSMTTGASSERASVVMGMEYTDRREIWQRDRDFSACPLGEAGGEIRCIGSGTTYPGHIFPSETAGDWIVDPDTGELRRFNNDDTYNYAAVSYMVTPSKVVSAYGDGRFDLIQEGDAFTSVTAFTNFLFSNRTSSQQMAPVGTFWAPEIGTDHPDNPFDETVFVARRLAEVTTGRFWTQDSYSWRSVSGFEGEFSNGWTWSLNYNYGRFSDGRVVFGQINQPRVDVALSPSACEADPDCPKVWNPFARDTLDQELQDYILVTHSPVGRRTLRVAQAIVAGDFGGFELPGGPIQWVAGIEQRKEDAAFIPDGAARLGQIYFVAGDETIGEISVDEYYGEINLPILDGAPFANYLGLDASVRRSDYGGEIGADTNWKGSIIWAPVEQLRLRATYAEGFRAPSIGELFAPQQKSAQQYNDPCLNYGANPDPTIQANCAADGLPPDFSLTSTQATSLFGGNPDLQPEQSESMSFGIVWTPEFVDDLSFRLDYFDIEITDAIGTAGTNNVILGCYGSQNFSSSLCNLIEGPGVVDEAPHPVSPYRNALQNISGIILTNANLSTFDTSGIDFGVDYSFFAGNGRFDLGVSGTWLDKHDYLPFEGADLVQAAGFIAEDQWSGNPASYAEWQDDIFASPANLVNTADSYWYHDVQGWYNWKNWDFTVGIRNALDEEPPYITNYDDMNTIQYSYDTAGRYYYFRVGFRM